ncbi:MAG: 5-(carboxyamino)imidazole ribonucleotide synthase [Ardenticatenales bacterium]|nr:5-(carboxyamino)imidazole ribonucleotide synthase [Ardenticatenales bacterium]
MSPSPLQPILPGATIGILGSGQLGRMLALEARRMGYRVHVFSPERHSPTGQVADLEIAMPYEELDAVRAFALGVDVITLEFENIPLATVEAAAEYVPVRPGSWVLHITQHRLREKCFLEDAGLPVTPFAPIHSLEELRGALDHLGYPAVLKTTAFGYDGKGQRKIIALEEAEAAWEAVGEQEAILEAFVPFERELSVVATRGVAGDFAHYGTIENLHWNHILDLSLAPARVPPGCTEQAVALTRAVLEQLDAVGVICVEFFLREDGTLFINEIAPRPHNSGHLTLDACITSQFEQQLRAVCGLPLGSTELLRPAAMANLLGHLWEHDEPDWAAACTHPGVKLHLYGKASARAGRKMGHLTALASTIEEARMRVLAAREALVGR